MFPLSKEMEDMMFLNQPVFSALLESKKESFQRTCARRILEAEQEKERKRQERPSKSFKCF
jgi:hypothetical protein